MVKCKSKRTLKKAFAAAMALGICVSVMSVQAFAAEMADAPAPEVISVTDTVEAPVEGDIQIPDKEIALDDVPKTGDVSLLALGLTSLLSGGGLVGLVGMGRKGKETE